MEEAHKLFHGRWSSQALTTAISTGMIDAISEFVWILQLPNANRGATTIEAIAQKTGVDPVLGYRLLRAMTGIGVLNESSDKHFSLTPTGEVFTSSHPSSLKHAMIWGVRQKIFRKLTLLALQRGCLCMESLTRSNSNWQTWSLC